MRPLLYTWDGNNMTPYGRMRELAQEQFVPGQRYMLEQSEQRTIQEHRQYFAWLNQAWANLPEQHDGRWADMDRMRKWALCETGYCTTTTHTFRTRREAERYIKERLEGEGDEIFIERIRTKVIVRRPKSQSFAAMTKSEFRMSKEKVVDFVSRLIGVAPDHFRKEALAHA